MNTFISWLQHSIWTTFLITNYSTYNYYNYIISNFYMKFFFNKNILDHSFYIVLLYGDV